MCTLRVIHTQVERKTRQLDCTRHHTQKVMVPLELWVGGAQLNALLQGEPQHQLLLAGSAPASRALILKGTTGVHTTGPAISGSYPRPKEPPPRLWARE